MQCSLTCASDSTMWRVFLIKPTMCSSTNPRVLFDMHDLVVSQCVAAVLNCWSCLISCNSLWQGDKHHYWLIASCQVVAFDPYVVIDDVTSTPYVPFNVELSSLNFSGTSLDLRSFVLCDWILLSNAPKWQTPLQLHWSFIETLFYVAVARSLPIDDWNASTQCSTWLLVTFRCLEEPWLVFFIDLDRPCCTS